MDRRPRAGKAVRIGGVVERDLSEVAALARGEVHDRETGRLERGVRRGRSGVEA